MRNIFLCLVLSGMTSAVLAETIRLSEPVQSDARSETFGAVMASDVEPLTLSAVLATPDKFKSEPVAIKVKVQKVCQKKGCFFVAQDGATSIRVAFKDYSFFVPTDIGGKTVTLVGLLQERELSDEEAAHYSKDLGGDSQMPAGWMHELIASSVRIPRS